MNSEIEAYLIKYIAGEWRSLRSDKWATRRDYSSSVQHEVADGLWNPLADERWPWGIWIRLHDPLPAHESQSDEGPSPNTPLRKAWFLNEDGLHPMDPWSFLRFWTTQFVRPWAAPDSYVEDVAFARPRWRIGYASFAEIAGSDEIYLETVWGSLWGSGRLVTIRDDSVHELRFLWIS